MTKKKGVLRIGTAGFAHDHWAGGFYPLDLPPAKRLEHYAKYFDLVEMDQTFFRIPTMATVSAWRERVPGTFVFAVRANKVITHSRMLHGCSEELATFRAAVSRFGNQLGPVHWQLPRGFRRDLPRLDMFLHVVTKTFRARHAIEFRHTTWFERHTYDVVRKHGVALVLADAPRTRVDDVLTTDFAYVRRYGPGGTYRKPYSEMLLREDAKRFREWIEKGIDVYVLFANHSEGHAARNARRLKDLCAQAPAPLLTPSAAARACEARPKSA